MLGIERALNTINGKNTDRPSVLPSIDVAYAPECAGLKVGECFKDTSLHANALMGALEKYPGTDGLYVNLCLESSMLKEGNGLYDDGYGLGWYVPEDDIGTVKKHSITELSDKLMDEDTSLKYGIINTFSKIDSYYKEKYLILPGITGPYSQVVFMLGLENVLMLMYDEPEELKAAIEKRVIYSVNWLKELVALGAKGVWLGEGAASSSVISPAAYKEFVAPYAKAVVEEAKALGIPCFMHVCGDIRPEINEILSTGCMQMDVDHMVPLEDVRDSAEDNVCLKGNIDPVFLLNASEQAVFNKAKEIIDSQNKPFILGTGCLVAKGTPKVNIDALVRASESYM